MNNSFSIIRDLFVKNGYRHYGEDCTIIAHSFQCGELAKNKGYPESVILGAYLHDIGHLLPNSKKGEYQYKFGNLKHEYSGASFLQKLGFGKQITSIVKHHVEAKRFLCWKYKSYLRQLSNASKETLLKQGGIMTTKEATIFKNHPFFQDIINVRLLDDEAKDPNYTFTKNSWEFLRYLIETMDR